MVAFNPLYLLAAVSAVQARATLPVVRQAAPPAANKWETLPETPALPAPINTVTSAINGVQLWSQRYNEAAGGTPILFIHGGLGYSAYFGTVIQQLMDAGRQVVAVDRRGHGRSTYAPDDVFTFEMFAADVQAQMTEYGIPTYDVVGWSDGAATTLTMLLDPAITPNIRKAFVFSGFMVPEDTNTTFTATPIYETFLSRCAAEYAVNQPTANFTDFALKVGTLEATLPQFTPEQLGAIDGAKVAIVGADKDEAVNLDVPAKLNAAIPGSSLVMLTDVSHFAPAQDPVQFTEAVTAFLV